LSALSKNDEAAIERLLDRALESGSCALVIDQPGSIESLAVCVARRRGVPVAYVPGLVMRRASQLYPEAIEAVFPQTWVQTWIVHQIRGSLRYVPYKDKRKIAAELNRLHRPQRRRSA
jgi:hypothetical protein